MPSKKRSSDTIAITPMRLAIIVVGVIMACFLGMQAIPVQRDNPPVLKEPTWDSPQTRALAQRACFDCHSNETKWPWYAYVAPVSWTVTTNVQAGRASLNFSEWGVPRHSSEGGVFQMEGGEGGEGVEPSEVSQTILEGRMPPPDYVAQHPEAQLTSDEKKQLATGLLATLLKP